MAFGLSVPSVGGLHMKFKDRQIRWNRAAKPTSAMRSIVRGDTEADLHSQLSSPFAPESDQEPFLSLDVLNSSISAFLQDYSVNSMDLEENTAARRSDDYYDAVSISGALESGMCACPSSTLESYDEGDTITGSIPDAIESSDGGLLPGNQLNSRPRDTLELERMRIASNLSPETRPEPGHCSVLGEQVPIRRDRSPTARILCLRHSVFATVIGR
ncbi:hypothetical protein JG687_00013500 [Phytophthora cactorum]|uniref:Uncharacterized protein n=1 Tax=Phytophthora cactorum TaxID=29920 RepID=A0A8T1U2E2_9STRA|nr:hypothetical protein JG687_00013500 [Phytophthora cactorum]